MATYTAAQLYGTGSIGENLSGATTFAFTNPSASSYFTLETVPNATGSYAGAPANTSGSWAVSESMGFVSSSYVASAIVQPGLSSLTFTPATSITGTTYRLRGTGTYGLIITAGGGGGSLLLDAYSGATAAYSLRKLSSTYSGAAIRVRRSSDNTETDIGFNGGGELDIVTLATFCGLNNGFVTIWYDQSGNGRNTIQTTAASQPLIVQSGNVLTVNNKPAILFNGNNYFVNTQTLTYGDFSLFMTTKYLSGLLLIQYSKLDLAIVSPLFQSSDTGIASIATYPAVDLGSVQKLHTHLSTLSGGTTTSTLYLNGTQKATGTRNLTSTKSTLAISATDTGTIGSSQNNQEIIIYSSNQIVNKAAIEANINSYYSIY